jgi:hypothetical protein
MQPFLVVHLLDEMGRRLGDIIVGLIVRQMDFLVRQCLEERFHVSVGLPVRDMLSVMFAPSRVATYS